MGTNRDINSIKTSWNVITGAPCSGKTTLIKMLHQMGFSTQCETAREVIQKLPNRDEYSAQLQLNIFNAQKSKEQMLDPNQAFYLDRAMPDTLAYLRLTNDMSSYATVKKSCSEFTYKNVFILSPVPIEDDGLRTTDSTIIAKHDSLLEEIYSELGHKTTRIPYLEQQPIKDRLDIILATLSEKS